MSSTAYTDEYAYHFFQFIFPLAIPNRGLYINWSPYDSASTNVARIERISNSGASVATGSSITQIVGAITILGY